MILRNLLVTTSFCCGLAGAGVAQQVHSFSALDTNADDALSTVELEAVFSAEDAAAVMTAQDADGDSLISRNEALAAARDMPQVGSNRTSLEDDVDPPVTVPGAAEDEATDADDDMDADADAETDAEGEDADDGMETDAGTDDAETDADADDADAGADADAESGSEGDSETD